MDFVEDFGATVYKYSSIGEHMNIFCIKGQDHPLTFNQCLSYFEKFKLSGLLK